MSTSTPADDLWGDLVLGGDSLLEADLVVEAVMAERKWHARLLPIEENLPWHP